MEGAHAGGNFRSYPQQDQPNRGVLTNHEEAHVCKEYQGTKQKLCDKHQKRNNLFGWVMDLGQANPFRPLKSPSVQQMKE